MNNDLGFESGERDMKQDVVFLQQINFMGKDVGFTWLLEQHTFLRKNFGVSHPIPRGVNSRVLDY